MTNVRKHLKYTEDHIWLDLEDDNTIRVGITEYAAEKLGDILEVSLPGEGDTAEAGSECGEIDCEDKGNVEIISPVTGEIQSINEDLLENPSLLVDDPWEDGWLFTIAPDDPTELKDLKSAEEYKELIRQLEDEAE